MDNCVGYRAPRSGPKPRSHPTWGGSAEGGPAVVNHPYIAQRRVCFAEPGLRLAASCYDAPRRRGASVAIATISSSGSIGLARCI